MPVYAVCVNKCWSRNMLWKPGEKRTFDTLEEAESNQNFKIINIDEQNIEKPEEEPKKRGRKPKSDEVE